jgi:hypothetical protein
MAENKNVELVATIHDRALRIRHLALAVIAGLILSPAFAGPAISTATGQLEGTTAKAMQKFDSGDTAVLAQKSADAAKILASKRDPNASQEYIASIDLDRRAIEKALATTSDSNSRLLLTAAAADLSIKANHAQSASIFSASATRVQVTVKTRRGDHEVNGYLVRANPVTAPNENPPRHAFPNPTTPSRSVMPPGQYYMWLEKDGYQLSRRIVPIGGNGEKEQEPIIFDVP